MQLIIKPSSACNFNCSFCSARKLNIPITEKVPEVLKEYIKKLKPKDIIITGGEPLMSPLSYYEDLLSLGDFTISFTSNLVLFYKNPEKWESLVKNDRVNFCTSFQYGDGRRYGQEIYEEIMFRKVFKLYEEVKGQKLLFISVINKENYHYALDHIYLAKELDTVCKLNGQCPLGASNEYFPRYKMLELYIKIIELGLDKYEANCRERCYKCPFSNSCRDNLRAVYVNYEGKLIENFCEDLLTSEGQMKDKNNKLLTDKCLMCELKNFCHSCEANLNYINDSETYCNNMLKLKNKLIEYGFRV